MKVAVSQKTNNWYYIKNLEQDYHCKEGILEISQLQSNSSKITSTKGVEFTLFNASHHDYIQKMKRSAQIIIPKDLGYIASRTSMNKETILLEAGSGSGFATTFFSGICKEIYTFERIESHFECAKKNIEQRGFSNTTIQLKDISEVLQEKNSNLPQFSMIFLDLPEPIEILKHVTSKHIINGGHIVCYLPSTRQVDQLVDFCSQENSQYFVEEVSESQIRNWRVNSKSNRPEHHKECDFTAFLIFLRYLG
ncbi:MAG: methyltransferase domain-containing protein [Nanoarchaeota archaeon]|nr:methyltransferase domain-containing protein [Nanoarchaeota archaeon]